MRKNILSIILVIAMVAALMLSITGCGSSDLKEENAALKAQVEELTQRLAAYENRPALVDWTLTGSAFSSNNGATVTVTATPTTYDESHTAALSVQLNGVEVEFVPCEWDAKTSTYTASVDLTAANGYGYYFIITTADGNPTRMELNTPNNITDDTLVYMENALSAYANMIMESWEEKDGKLVVTSGFVQVQMPRLTAGDGSGYAGSQLILKSNGTEVDRKAIDLPAGEGAGSYEAAVSNQTFALPAIESDAILELWLEVTLSNGQTIDTCACTWTYMDGTLMPSVG
jgi:hypothetical protein